MFSNIDFKRADEFERLAISLIRQDCYSNQIPLFIEGEFESKHEFDAVAPIGYASVPGPCGIQVVFIPECFDAEKRGLRIIKSALSKLRDMKSSLYITNLSDETITLIKDKIDYFNNKISYEIFGVNKINELSNKYPSIAMIFKNEYLEKCAETVDEYNLQNENQKHFDSLSRAYSNDHLVLFLGAGVSLDAGVPDWKGLLNDLYLNAINRIPMIKKYITKIEDIKEHFLQLMPTSPLISATLLRAIYEDQFAEFVRNAIYKNIKPNANTNTIKEIGNLCMPTRNIMGLHSIVNYNFDDLLSIELSNRNIRHKIILTEKDEPNNSEIPIYHPHGYLPRDIELNEQHTETLTLSEHNYHKYYNDPFVWQNLTQVELLRNMTVLFIGMSINDPDLRRLLQISQEKKPGLRHYVIMEDRWSVQNIFEQKTANILSYLFKKAEEKSYAQLGISIIWVKKYSEIPNIIKGIYAQI